MYKAASTAAFFISRRAIPSIHLFADHRASYNRFENPIKMINRLACLALLLCGICVSSISISAQSRRVAPGGGSDKPNQRPTPLPTPAPTPAPAAPDSPQVSNDANCDVLSV